MITSPKPTGKELWKAFVDAIWALLMPVIILGGIYGGYFTPTEAAAVAVVYGLIIGLFVYRELKWKDIPKTFVNAARTSAAVMMIIVTAATFAIVLTRNNIPTLIGNWIIGIAKTPLMCAIGALIRRKDSKQSIVPINKCLSEASMWTMISLVGALVMLGKVTSDANLGIRQWLVEVLSPLFGGANIWVLMAIVILFSTLVTQVANGLVLTMAVCPVVTPFVCSLAATTGINPDVILIISNICSGYAFWTVAASTNAAFILGRPEITPKFVWTKGVQTTVLFMVICYICGMAFTYIL